MAFRIALGLLAALLLVLAAKALQEHPHVAHVLITGELR